MTTRSLYLRFLDLSHDYEARRLALSNSLLLGRSELMVRDHDEEWGVPVHDDRTLFEFLILEGAQAGLSWETILNKRENYRAAFDGFDAEKIARYDARKLAQLMKNPGIVRNRLKIASAVRNAQAFLRVQKEFDSFDRYVWQFVEGCPRVNSGQ